MIRKYRKKPVVIEAIQWTGRNFDEVVGFTNHKCFLERDNLFNPDLYIESLEGALPTSFGDYIIKGIKGEFYPCKPDIFEMTYEEIKEEK